MRGLRMKSKYALFLAENLDELMKRSGEYKSSLAKTLEISRPHLDDILNAATNPTLQTIEKIGTHFEIDPALLLMKAMGKQRADGFVETPGRLLERIATETTKLRAAVGDIPADILDLLVKEAASGSDGIFVAIREQLGATSVHAGKQKSTDRSSGR
jgi:transcriptional regulator with XRE-family HTH domain